ncbi:GvpL/GvpF family gas vesicle protein [Streptomyces sp. ISL-94]|uniref:GvpL/GvpF family gas vesicle protein n=1 Tax=Streptomyces sp. ISL-94 TaxID=2819190 RepID=UPI001BE6A1EA|nr:GvpL/GvpF family gas vesicle protein [Streptomyces sp. ISL-94]MBT2482332.1 GvpL/GvpF family gas vesicle protein [Streptomyces sp. ISL-94]
MSGPQLFYVYTVVGSGTGALDTGEFRGLSGSGITVVGDDVLAAVAEPVDPAEFDESALPRRLEDLDWLSHLARTHHQVVAAVGRSLTTVPLRLATVCRGEEGVLRLLAEGRDRLSRALARVAGTEEWGVKLYAADSAPAAPAGSSPTGPSGAADPSDAGTATATGRDYLRRRLGERRRREERAGLAARTAEQLHRKLAAQAAEAVLHPPQQTQLSGTPDTNVLNAAYLVPCDARPAFLDTVPRSADLPPGLRSEITGPWVPYSFTQAADPQGPEQ